jgi:hypothetical protein
MKEFIAACVQIAVTPNDVQANVDKGVTWLEKAITEEILKEARSWFEPGKRLSRNRE